MYKLKKDGLIRIVATKAEMERWKALGYAVVSGEDPAAPAAVGGTPDPLTSMDEAQLMEYAKLNGIDIGNATSKNGILKKIREARPAETGGE
jgi:hypothetical protein